MFVLMNKNLFSNNEERLKQKKIFLMEQHTQKNVSNCQNSKIYFYLVTSGGENFIYIYYCYLFFEHQYFRHLWQFKRAVFLHRCLSHSVLFYILMSLRICSVYLFRAALYQLIFVSHRDALFPSSANMMAKNIANTRS